MSGARLFDFLLGTFVLAVVPLFMAAYGGHLAALTLNDPRVRRNAKFIFWGSCLFGILVAAVYQYRAGKIDEEREYKSARAEAERQKKIDESQQETLKAQADLRAIERSNGDQIRWMQKRLDAVIANAQSSNQQNAAREIKNELAELTQSLKLQHTQPTLITIPSSAQPNNTVTQAPPKPCRGDSLGECSNDALLEWGKPLMENIEALEDKHMADLKRLDDMKGSWMGFLIGKDKDSKWLKAYSEAQEKAADGFRDCCAESALTYHHQLVQRIGGGQEKNELYDWIQKLLKLPKSREWKEARQEGGSKIVDITADLHSLQFKLRMLDTHQAHR